MSVQDALARLLEGHDLSRDEARAVMNEVMDGEATPAQIGGLLVALRLKGETADEITGCAEAMREHVLAVRPKRDDLVDTAGTGGDGAGTINISTAAALVAAAAGAGVAKHGNRAVSSASGSADVLEALGFQLELPPARIERSIDELGFGFLFAPTHHPAMRHAAPVRRELAARTVFNLLGPLTNPAGARAQVVGVYAPSLVRTIAEVLAQLGARRAFVVHGAGGIDELSPAGPNLVCEVVEGSIHEREIDPLELGVPRCDPADLRGGSPEENATAIRQVFAGEEGGRREAILLNAAGAIAASGRARDLGEGLGYARQALDSGAAAARLEELIAFSHVEEVPA
jgi:anthranilate phosphoribosyltransferase